MKPVIEVMPLQEFCAVCGRVRWSPYQPLGCGMWRHWECQAGSRDWIEAQLLKPENKRSKLLKYFLKH